MSNIVNPSSKALVLLVIFVTILDPIFAFRVDVHFAKYISFHTSQHLSVITSYVMVQYSYDAIHSPTSRIPLIHTNEDGQQAGPESDGNHNAANTVLKPSFGGDDFDRTSVNGENETGEQSAGRAVGESVSNEESIPNGEIVVVESIPNGKSALGESVCNGKSALGESVCNGKSALGESVCNGKSALGESIPKTESVPNGKSAQDTSIPNTNSVPEGEENTAFGNYNKPKTSTYLLLLVYVMIVYVIVFFIYVYLMQCTTQECLETMFSCRTHAVLRQHITLLRNFWLFVLVHTTWIIMSDKYRLDNTHAPWIFCDGML